jgi:hypothetical protein
MRGKALNALIISPRLPSTSLPSPTHPLPTHVLDIDKLALDLASSSGARFATALGTPSHSFPF